LVERVLDALPATLAGLQAEVNLGRGRLETLLKVLDVEGAVARGGTGWVRTGAPWGYDADRYRQVTAQRRAEQEAMFAYGEDGRCLMQALQDELDDPRAKPCGRCSVCAGARFDAPVDPALARRAYALVRAQPLVLTVRRQTPRTAEQPGRRIGPELLLEEGRALARAGEPRPAGRQRPRAVPRRRRAAGRAGPAGRRRALLGLDADDGGRAAAREGRGAAASARALARRRVARGPGSRAS